MGVAQPVGVHALGDPGLAAQPREEHPDVAVVEGLTVEHTEDGGAVVEAEISPDLHPGRDQLERPAVHAHRAGPAALGEGHAHGAVAGVQVIPRGLQMFKSTSC